MLGIRYTAIPAAVRRAAEESGGFPPAVHVAGTNGKGSVCRYVAGILQAAGYKTGLFVSPHVRDIRERVSVNGEPIPKTRLAELLTWAKQAGERLCPDEELPEFARITMAAIAYFNEIKCDVAVLETGLGGLYDPTNAVERPLCTAVTSVSLDHTALLGGTVAEIAEQKAGIFKPGRPVVLYPLQEPSAMRVLQSAAKAKGCPVFLPDLARLRVTDRGLAGSEVAYGDLTFRLRMPGAFQPFNAATAIEIVQNCGLVVPKEAYRRGLESAVLPARCEVVRTSPPLVLDGAHNPGAMRALAAFVRSALPRPVTAVMGMMADKDAVGALDEISGCFSHIFCVAPAGSRALPAADLAKIAGRHTRAEACEDVASALRRAESAGAATVVCGSFYLFEDLPLGGNTK